MHFTFIYFSSFSCFAQTLACSESLGQHCRPFYLSQPYSAIPSSRYQNVIVNRGLLEWTIVVDLNHAVLLTLISIWRRPATVLSTSTTLIQTSQRHTEGRNSLEGPKNGGLRKAGASYIMGITITQFRRPPIYVQRFNRPNIQRLCSDVTYADQPQRYWQPS